MAKEPNFASILDEAPTEVERPVPLPVGTYLCTIKGTPRYDKSSKKQTDFVEFTAFPVSAMEDVDEEELETAGGFEGKSFKLTYYLTPDAVYRLDEFHEHCGLDLSSPMSRRQRNEEVTNCQIKVVIKHELSQDGQQQYARVSRTAVAD